MTRLVIRKFLEASLYHVPKSIYTQALQGKGPLSTWVSGYGFFAFVAERVSIKESVPQSVAQLFDKAREHDCGYILFDCDGETIEGVEVFDWDDIDAGVAEERTPS